MTLSLAALLASAAFAAAGSGAERNREGMAHLHAGRHDDAVVAFSRGLRLQPEDPALRYNLALAYYLKGEPDRAAVELRELLRRSPKEAPPYELLGKIIYDRGDTDGAAEVLKAGREAAGLTAAGEALLRKARRESALDAGVSHFFDFRYDGTRRRELLGREHVVARMLDEAYAQVGRRLNFFPEDRVQVILYDAGEFAAALRPDAWARGVFDGKIRVPVRDFEDERERLKAVLVHEYTHAVVHRLSPLCPAWLNEGLATLMEWEGAGEAAGARLKGGPLLSPGRLRAPFAGLGEREARIAYDMAASMTGKLERDHGLHAIVAYLRDLGRREGAQDELFQEYFYQSYEEFFERWREGL